MPVVFGPVVTTEAHLAYAGAKVHSNHTAEMSAIVEALFFLGPGGPVSCDACSFVFHDSKHAAGVRLGTIHACTAWTLLPTLLKVQHRLRFTMQHVYSHAENLGNECADHAAALGAFGLESNHNPSTRWARHSCSIDSESCFAKCHNLGDVLEKLRDIRTARVSRRQTPGVSVVFHAVLRFVSFCLCHIPLGCFSVIRLARSFAVTVPANMITYRFFL